MSIENLSYRIFESEGPLQVCLALNYATDAPFTADVDIRGRSNPLDARGKVLFPEHVIKVLLAICLESVEWNGRKENIISRY